MYRRIVTGILVLAASGVLLVGCQRHHHSDAQMADHAAKVLELDAGQRDRMVVLMGEVRAAHERVRAARAALMTEAIAQMRADRVDTDALDAAIGTARRAADDALTLLGGKLAEVHALLTPEQRSRLADMLERHQTRHGEGGSHHGWNP